MKKEDIKLLHRKLDAFADAAKYFIVKMIDIENSTGLSISAPKQGSVFHVIDISSQLNIKRRSEKPVFSGKMHKCLDYILDQWKSGKKSPTIEQPIPPPPIKKSPLKKSKKSRKI